MQLRKFLPSAVSLFALLTAPLGVASAQADSAKKAPAANTAWSIPWLQGTELTSKTVVIKRFGRLERNELWDNIMKLVDGVMTLPERFPQAAANPKVRKDFEDMRAYAHFYRGRNRGRLLIFEPPATEEERQAGLRSVLEDLQEAVKLGFANPDEFEGAKELYGVWDTPEYQSLVKSLRSKAEEGMRADYRREVDAGFERLRTAEPGVWKPALQTLEGAPFWPADDSGMAVVVTRIHHDGFDKLAPRLRALRSRLGDRCPPIGVVFYQHTTEDAARVAQTRSYVEHLAVDFPCAVVDRALYLELRELLRNRYLSSLASIEDEKQRAALATYDIFQPVIVFFLPDGTPAYQTNGVLQDWQLEHVAQRFLERLAPPSAPENGDADPAPEEPAPEEPAPEEPAPEEPAPEEPAPEEPAPEEPAPEEPAPEEPAPEEPAPEDPAPEDPAPEDPAPEEPAPEEPAPPAESGGGEG